MEQYGRGEEVEEKHTLIFEIDKELIMPNGMVLLNLFRSSKLE